MSGNYPLPNGDLKSLGFASKPLDNLDALIRSHIDEGRYPGAQIALARHGKLAMFRTYGDAKTDGGKQPATNETLFLLFSQTKVLTSSALWTLVEEGKLSFMDKVTEFLPEFAARGKADITLEQVMSHRGGFPSSDVTKATWTNHKKMLAEVCDFSLDWTPGTRLQYHGRAAHLTQAMVIEAVTGQDYRDVIRTRVLEPLGLANDIFVGVPEARQSRCADTYANEARDNSADFKAAGLPHSGGYATARGMAAFYQLLGHGGRLGDLRLFSPRLISYVSRNHTAEMGDIQMDGIPMHRGLGPHVRGESERIRGLGTIGAPVTFGHGGAGTSYSWADPASGVSFSYLTNRMQDDPWHSSRLDRVANLVHAAID
ncbi:MAG: class A beta-lactamase-related serine hydrolase [Acetobacteraceae bacterium]|nr:class A beta-lactamase-related serine hydrolase [Acetobacteraceae bacterium]